MKRDIGIPAWGAFVREIRAFMDDEELASNPAHAVAVLVRETAVAAFVRGAMWPDAPMPPDSEMLRQAREAAHDFPDLYPAWTVLEMHSDRTDD